MRYDVLVVGAGPAGSTAAYRLASEGARVLLVDTRKRVGFPVQCAEFVPLQLSHHFPEFFTGRTVVQKVKDMVHYTPWGEVVRFPSEGFMLNRESFDALIAELAQKKGAELLTRHRFEGFSGKGVLIRNLRSGEILEVQADYVIGADGARSAVARKTGPHTRHFLATAQVTLPLRQYLGDLLIFFRDYIPAGYGWLFPKGRVANVGVGLDPSFGVSPSWSLSKFLEEVGDWVETDKVLARSGGFIPAEGVLRPVRGRVLLVGDAGGFCHPITGGGIANAVLTGSMAAEAVLGEDPEEYEEEAMETIGVSVNRAAQKRKKYMNRWDDLREIVPRTWIAFPEYYRD